MFDLNYATAFCVVSSTAARTFTRYQYYSFYTCMIDLLLLCVHQYTDYATRYRAGEHLARIERMTLT